VTAVTQLTGKWAAQRRITSTQAAAIQAAAKASTN
jgi:hypothetical protein